MHECAPVLLEPILHVEISVPSDATTKTNAVVSQRRGQLMGFDSRPNWPGWDVIEALIPEAEIGDLIVELRSATAGVGTFTSHFDHLSELSGRLAEEATARAHREAAGSKERKENAGRTARAGSPLAVPASANSPAGGACSRLPKLARRLGNPALREELEHTNQLTPSIWAR